MTNGSIFYGRWVVAAFSVTTFISTGIRHAVGPFLKSIVGDLGLDRASFSAVIALSLFLYGVFMPLAGMALDRFSVRVVTSLGTVLLVISLVLPAMVRNFWSSPPSTACSYRSGLPAPGP
jgi:MFS family permease